MTHVRGIKKSIFYRFQLAQNLFAFACILRCLRCRRKQTEAARMENPFVFAHIRHGLMAMLFLEERSIRLDAPS